MGLNAGLRIRRREKPLAPTGIRNTDRAARSLVTPPTKLSRFHSCPYTTTTTLPLQSFLSSPKNILDMGFCSFAASNKGLSLIDFVFIGEFNFQCVFSKTFHLRYTRGV